MVVSVGIFPDMQKCLAGRSVLGAEQVCDKNVIVVKITARTRDYKYRKLSVLETAVNACSWSRGDKYTCEVGGYLLPKWGYLLFANSSM